MLVPIQWVPASVHLDNICVINPSYPGLLIAKPGTTPQLHTQTMQGGLAVQGCSRQFLRTTADAQQFRIWLLFLCHRMTSEEEIFTLNPLIDVLCRSSLLFLHLTSFQLLRGQIFRPFSSHAEEDVVSLIVPRRKQDRCQSQLLITADGGGRSQRKRSQYCSHHFC